MRARAASARAFSPNSLVPIRMAAAPSTIARRICRPWWDVVHLLDLGVTLQGHGVEGPAFILALHLEAGFERRQKSAWWWWGASAHRGPEARCRSDPFTGTIDFLK